MTEQVEPIAFQDLKSGFSISFVLGILMIVLGAVAIARSLFAGVAANSYLGLVFVVGGITLLVYTIQTLAKRQFWKLLMKPLGGIVFRKPGSRAIEKLIEREIQQTKARLKALEDEIHNYNYNKMQKF
ncbi:MAG: DUF308 domain-containing protein [Xenococcaceae cyanobacterium MO_234.B1]|nr:DUF308 domain-containing protein [Xenococcaceae cyanobacterium MO_234.B1]